MEFLLHSLSDTCYTRMCNVLAIAVMQTNILLVLSSCFFGVTFAELRKYDSDVVEETYNIIVFMFQLILAPSYFQLLDFLRSMVKKGNISNLRHIKDTQYS